MSAVAYAAVQPDAYRTSPVGSAAPLAAPAARPVTGPYRKRDPLGDPTPLVCTVTRIALDVALGGGGIDQLTRWVTPTVRSALLRQHSLSQRARYAPRGATSVVRVRLCRVSPTAVEAGVVALEGDRAHALALRLEAVAGRWLVTVLDVG